MIEPEFIEQLRLSTPVGHVLIRGNRNAVTHIDFEGTAARGRFDTTTAQGPVHDAARQLEQYFARGRTAFDVPIAPSGTPFQQRVWDELRTIPYGATASYGDIARRIGQPSASRAVGAANGANPIPIIIPCHRAIGADGSMTGFGGGIEAKRTLLRIEAGQQALIARASGEAP